MDPNQIEAWITVLSVLVDTGEAIAGKLAPILALFRKDHTLTEDQINGMEQTAMFESQARRARRVAMGQSSL